MGIIKHKYKSKSKKAQINSIIALLITIFVVGLSILVGKHILFSVDAAMVEGDMHTNESADVLLQVGNSWATFDYAMVFIVISLTIILLITSFLIPAHPAFMFINVFGIVILVFVAGLLTNFYGEVIDSGEFNESMTQWGNDLSNTQFIMQKLPWICAFVTMVSTVVMYGKAREGLS